MRGLLGRIWLGLALTAATLAGAASIPRLIGASGAPWPKLAVVALLGESVLLVMAARRGTPVLPPLERGEETGQGLPPLPVPADPRWLWNAVPTAVFGLALFVAILLA
ncbi:MAG TPA: hypothetical protein VMU89_20350 [Thermomicrobiaceae bacterium]|nr:hypothetical protein [Thermomicrobiaceae bacterium]